MIYETYYPKAIAIYSIYIQSMECLGALIIDIERDKIFKKKKSLEEQIDKAENVLEAISLIFSSHRY